MTYHDRDHEQVSVRVDSAESLILTDQALLVDGDEATIAAEAKSIAADIKAKLTVYLDKQLQAAAEFLGSVIAARNTAAAPVPSAAAVRSDHADFSSGADRREGFKPDPRTGEISNEQHARRMAALSTPEDGSIPAFLDRTKEGKRA